MHRFRYKTDDVERVTGCNHSTACAVVKAMAVAVDRDPGCLALTIREFEDAAWAAFAAVRASELAFGFDDPLWDMTAPAPACAGGGAT